MENQERLIKYGHTRHRTKANKTPKNTTYHGKLKRSVTQTNQKPAVCFVVISIYIMVQSSALSFQNVLLARMVSIVKSGVMHVLTRCVNHVMGIIHMVV